MIQFPITGDWHNLYAEKWSNQITPESTAHPAKFARALIRQINKWLLDEGLVNPGDTILDPFGGVGLGALDALFNGCNYIGIELEQRFVDMGAGCNCTGISKADWVRFCGRWDRANYKDGRHWCPQCLAEAKKVLPPESKLESPQLSFLDKPVSYSAVYIQNSGKIPYTEPHRYEGNLSLFMRHAQNRTRAILLQGDSRRLIEVLQQNGIGAVVSSPPYADGERGHPSLGSVNKDNWGAGGLYRDPKRRNDTNLTGTYGESDGQLGAMKAGEIKGVIGSPPYEGSRIPQENSNIDNLRRPNDREVYGISTGQIGKTNGDTFWSAARLILEQCYLLLPDGGASVPDEDGVDFCDCLPVNEKEES